MLFSYPQPPDPNWADFPGKVASGPENSHLESPTSTALTGPRQAEWGTSFALTLIRMVAKSRLTRLPEGWRLREECDWGCYSEGGPAPAMSSAHLAPLSCPFGGSGRNAWGRRLRYLKYLTCQYPFTSSGWPQIDHHPAALLAWGRRR
jgi:hypothetical protein